MTFNVCYEARSKPSLDMAKALIEAIRDSVKEASCKSSEGPTWVLGSCEGGVLVKAALTKPSPAPGTSLYLALSICLTSRSPESVFEVASTLASGLARRGVPVELILP